MATKEQSTWLATASLPSYPKLQKDTEVDVAVLGGGLAGLMSAYLLAKDGKKVAVIDKDRFMGLGSGYTTGFLSQSIDTDTVDQVPMWGDDGAKLIWQSHGVAIDLIERIAKEENIECEFVRCDNYAYATDRKEARELDDEFTEMKRLGFPVAKKSPELGFRNRGVLYHSVKFAAGLLKVLEGMGAELYEKTEAKEITGDGPFVVRTTGKQIRAAWTLTATYQPFNNPREVKFQKGMYRTYIIELEAPKGKYPEGIYEDFDNPYQYFRVDAGKGAKGKDRIILGGEDHREELTTPKMKAKSYRALEEYAQELFGKEYLIIRRWSGLILEPVDGLALIGEYDPNRLIATAFSGNGMTYSTITALIVRDAVNGKKSPYAELYSPNRKMTFTQLWKKGRDYTEEFFRGAVANFFQQPDSK
jgi:glycine/D-amino acid oxidase-like deaminating enzyme